jgi:hypothetical protein
MHLAGYWDTHLKTNTYGVWPVRGGLDYPGVAYPGADYCRDYGPCSEGEGDCDGDSECASGLICAQDVGANYGRSSLTDVCEDKPSCGG